MLLPYACETLLALSSDNIPLLKYRKSTKPAFSNNHCPEYLQCRTSYKSHSPNNNDLMAQMLTSVGVNNIKKIKKVKSYSNYNELHNPTFNLDTEYFDIQANSSCHKCPNCKRRLLGTSESKWKTSNSARSSLSIFHETDFISAFDNFVDCIDHSCCKDKDPNTTKITDRFNEKYSYHHTNLLNSKSNPKFTSSISCCHNSIKHDPYWSFNYEVPQIYFSDDRSEIDTELTQTQDLFCTISSHSIFGANHDSKSCIYSTASLSLLNNSKNSLSLMHLQNKSTDTFLCTPQTTTTSSSFSGSSEALENIILTVPPLESRIKTTSEYSETFGLELWSESFYGAKNNNQNNNNAEESDNVGVNDKPSNTSPSETNLSNNVNNGKGTNIENGANGAENAVSYDVNTSGDITPSNPAKDSIHSPMVTETNTVSTPTTIKSSIHINSDNNISRVKSTIHSPTIESGKNTKLNENSIKDSSASVNLKHHQPKSEEQPKGPRNSKTHSNNINRVSQSKPSSGSSSGQRVKTAARSSQPANSSIISLSKSSGGIIHKHNKPVPIDAADQPYLGPGVGRRSQTNISISKPDRKCCFCWCGCCKCSWLPLVNERKNSIKKRESKQGSIAEIEQLSYDEIKAWETSFDRLMKTPCGRNTFREFLKHEYSEENMLFWMACEELRKEENQEAIEEKARMIYEDYISILSPKEVSLDSRVRELINRKMIEPSRETFDEAQLQIYTLMHRDSYPRFINSTFYKNLVDKYRPKNPTA